MIFLSLSLSLSLTHTQLAAGVADTNDDGTYTTGTHTHLHTGESLYVNSNLYSTKLFSFTKVHKISTVAHADVHCH